MPISYTQLSTYILLQDKCTYNLMNEICGTQFDDWDIKAFERAVLGEKSQVSYNENDVRDAIYEHLLELDKTKPSLLYLEQGTHYGSELFRIVPESGEPRSSFKMLWSHLSRVFSDYVLPIDKDEFRKLFTAELEQIGIRLQTNRDYKITQFAVNDRFGKDGIINAKDIRYAMYFAESQNRAFNIRTANCGDEAYLDVIRDILEDRAEKYSNEDYSCRLKESFDIHTLCLMVDSSCTEKQREAAFLHWGIFTGEPLTYAECGRRLGVTGNNIIRCEHAVIRHLLKNKKALFDWEWKYE